MVAAVEAHSHFSPRPIVHPLDILTSDIDRWLQAHVDTVQRMFLYYFIMEKAWIKPTVAGQGESYELRMRLAGLKLDASTIIDLEHKSPIIAPQDPEQLNQARIRQLANYRLDAQIWDDIFRHFVQELGNEELADQALEKLVTHTADYVNKIRVLYPVKSREHQPVSARSLRYGFTALFFGFLK